MSGPPPDRRSIRPRKRGFTRLPIIAVDHQRGALTEQGEVLDFEDFCKYLAACPPHIVVCPDGAQLLALLDERFGTSAYWQYRITPVKHHVMRANGSLSSWQNGRTLVNFFGWMRASGKVNSRYHHPIDPTLFSKATMLDLVPNTPNRTVALMEWAQDVREWCMVNNLQVSPTAGGLAAQLLRDKRFFPQVRRKVPAATNDHGRTHLPGNYYRLFTDVSGPHTAYYLDMSAAHHTIASSLQFPHPDTLMARGRFHHVPGATGVTLSNMRYWLRSGTPAFDHTLTDGRGLLCVKMVVPPLRDYRYPPPYMCHAGARTAWIYTNELPTIHELGGRIEAVIAGWLSYDTDPGMNRYARYALTELEASSGARKRWLKATLLAPYGMVAARAQEFETAFKQADTDLVRGYPAGSSLLRAHAVTRPAQESGIVNTIYRGMIEAEQRCRALSLARYLHSCGVTILGIYADSVFADTNAPLPFLPEGWRVEQVLDGLFFSSATHFTSRQLTKLPGVPRDAIDRVGFLADMRHRQTLV